MKLWAIVFAFHHMPIPTTGTDGNRTSAPACAAANVTKRASQAACRTRTNGSSTSLVAIVARSPRLTALFRSRSRFERGGQCRIAGVRPQFDDADVGGVFVWRCRAIGRLSNAYVAPVSRAEAGDFMFAGEGFQIGPLVPARRLFSLGALEVQ